MLEKEARNNFESSEESSIEVDSDSLELMSSEESEKELKKD